jgi:hypothetical protein
MRRDHEAKLNAALDQLFLQGSTSILWEDLYLWYNADRLSKRAYADIIDRWRAICEEYGQKPNDIPELEELQSSDTWLILRRGLFKFYQEKITALAERA